MKRTEWLPTRGAGICTHTLEDGQSCGQPAVMINPVELICLCEEHAYLALPGVGEAREQRRQEQEKLLNALL